MNPLSLLGLSTTSIKGTITLVLLVILLLSGFGFYFWTSHTKAVLEEQLIAEKAKSEQLGRDNAVIKKVNEVNAATIENLRNDQLLGAQTLSNLATQMSKDKQSLAKIAATIGSLPPGSDGPISPVLKQTVQGIQTIRDTRIPGEAK